MLMSLPEAPLVIGLHGPRGVGKDPIARALRKLAGERIAYLPSNVAAYDMLRKLLEFYEPEEAEAEAWLAERRDEPCPHLGGRTMRLALQTLQTEWGRSVMGGELWRAAWRGQCENLLAIGFVVVNASVRFEDEAAAVRAFGGIMVDVSRPGHVVDDPHVSERQRVDCDFRVAITDPGGVEAAARQILETIGGE
ncbi:MAG: hypothetical protein AAFW01_00060 [Pseudomonadota bacterium]